MVPTFQSLHRACLYFYCATKVIQHTGSDRVDQHTFCITSKVRRVALVLLLTVENVNCKDVKDCLSVFPETGQQHVTLDSSNAYYKHHLVSLSMTDSWK